MRQANEASVPVLFRVNGDGLDTRVYRRTNYSDRDFASIGDENLRNSSHRISLLGTKGAEGHSAPYQLFSTDMEFCFDIFLTMIPMFFIRKNQKDYSP